MDGEIILGQVCESWLASAQQIALLDPLYVLNKETGLWVEIEDVRAKFPNRGRVTWVKPADEAIVGSIWVFTYDVHPSFDPRDPRHDRYRINWDRPPNQLREVIDLKAANADVVFKRVDQGLKLPFIPTRLTYVMLDGQTWAGPLKLVQHQGRWVLDDHQRNLPIPRVAALSDTRLVRLYVDGRRTFMRYDAPEPTKVGELDWAPDQLVIQRLLNTARKNPELSRVFTLTKATIQQIIEKLPAGDDETTAQQLTRARSYLADVDRIQTDLAAFEVSLLALPAVEERIAKAECEGRDSARAKAEAEVIAQARQELERLREQHLQLTRKLEAQQAQLAEIERHARSAAQKARETVDAEVRRREEELGALDQQIDERQKLINDQIRLADAVITQRVAELVSKPAEALAQIALVRAAMGVIHPVGSLPSEACRGILPPASVLQDDGDIVDDQQKLILLGRRALQAAGLPSLASTWIHTALVAGKMPLVSGAGALDALEQYARVATSGRMLWLSVPPITLEPTDLLGKYDSHIRQFAPHPSGLLDLLIYARQPAQQDRTFLVVLEGVNRAAVDAYLLPLLACYRSARCDTVRKAVRLAHPSVFAPEDPYFAAAELTWPANVLLTGTLIDGPATISLPPSLWADASYIDLDSTAGSIKAPSDEAPARSSVPFKHWLSWQSLCTSDAQAGVEAFESLNINGFRLPAPIIQSFARVYTASRRCVRTSEDAIRVAAHFSLVPYALATQQTEVVAQLLEAAAIELDEAALEMMRAVLQ